MRRVVLAHAVDWDGFRAAVRRLAREGAAPEQVDWSVSEPPDLFTASHDDADARPDGDGFKLPRALVELAQTVIQARDAERFALLYGLIWRAHAGERRLLEAVGDPPVARATGLALAVRRDTHRMRAFVRFRDAGQGALPRYVAWYEPEHFIAEANAGFFARRFAGVGWSILTPYRGVYCDGSALRFGPGADQARLPDPPVAATSGEKYWRNLPPAAALPEIIGTPNPGAEEGQEPPLMPPPRSPRQSRSGAATQLAHAAAEAADCRRCALWKPATQTVWGEGPADAAIMFVGEQPGDQEDLVGRPFVGPAGQLFDRAMDEAGLDRATVYVTNAVKHFKFEPRGKRRIHAKPDTTEIAACAPWLEIERAEIMPRLIVLMGATAARAVLGRVVGITRERGRPLPLGNGQGLVTVHPSYLLRLPDEAAKAREYAAFVADLRLAARLAA